MCVGLYKMVKAVFDFKTHLMENVLLQDYLTKYICNMSYCEFESYKSS